MDVVSKWIMGTSLSDGSLNVDPKLASALACEFWSLGICSIENVLKYSDLCWRSLNMPPSLNPLRRILHSSDLRQ